jgi:phosphohistidine phosphatase
MDLLLVRHAIAIPQAEDLLDADRSLTLRGRKRFARAARGLDRLALRFDRVLYSPWRRAAETAEMLAPLAGGRLVPCGLLAEPPSPALFELLEGGCVALVGHEPWLTELFAWLTVGRRAEARFVVKKLKKGGVAWLTGEPRERGMELVALLPPKVLRALGRRAAD